MGNDRNKMASMGLPAKEINLVKHCIFLQTHPLPSSAIKTLTIQQISELKKYLSLNCIIYVRACRDANGKNAQNKYRRFAKRIKRLVVAYQGYVSPLGGNPSHVKEFDVKNMRFYIIWYPECQPVIFSPY